MISHREYRLWYFGRFKDEERLHYYGLPGDEEVPSLEGPEIHSKLVTSSKCNSVGTHTPRMLGGPEENLPIVLISPEF